MGMEVYEELKDMLCEELEQIVDKGEITMGDLEIAYKLTGTIKNIGKIEMLEEENEYSYEGSMRADGNYAADGNYSADGSYRRSRSGRSSRRSYARSSRRSRSGDDRVAQKINDMMMSGNLSSDEKNTLKMALEALEK